MGPVPKCRVKQTLKQERHEDQKERVSDVCYRSIVLVLGWRVLLQVLGDQKCKVTINLGGNGPLLEIGKTKEFWHCRAVVRIPNEIREKAGNN
jgi:hypothetical protein